jgi:hypothetical protein
MMVKYQKWIRGACPALAIILWCCGLSLVECLAPKYLWAEDANVGPLLVYIVDPTANRMILPDSSSLPGERTSTIHVSACRGELGSASFIIRPLRKDINDLRIHVTDLKGTSESIPSRNIDLTIVKAWFQGGNAWSTIRASQTAILVPELLLHDDGLISVDMKKEMNSVKLSNAGQTRYESISERSMASQRTVLHSVESFPVRDAATLQPFNVPSHENRQLVIKIRVPMGATSDTYEGKVVIQEGGNVIGTLSLTLTVLPFELELPRIEYSIYYRGILTNGQGTISSEDKSELQLRAELQDMWDHGVRNPTSYQPFSDKQLLRKVLDIRRSIGMKGRPLYYLGVATGNPDSDQAITGYRRAVDELRALGDEYGITDIYVYGIDEASSEMISRQRKAWKAIHDAGGKLFAAGWTPGHFELLGDILDLFVDGQIPKKTEADKFHSVKHRVFSYNTPQAGVENPFVYRKNYGLRVWQQDYDGAMAYAYQDGFGSIWNDFDHPKFRDHNFTYPTVNGVIDTLAWEGFREGVDDVRYITTLEKSLANTESSRLEAKQGLVLEARNFLENLRAYTGDDIEGMRHKIVSYIIQLDSIRLGTQSRLDKPNSP